MNGMVLKPRKKRIHENRKELFRKRIFEGIRTTLFTSSLMGIVFCSGGSFVNAQTYFENYKVQNGDTIYNISKRFGSSVIELKSVNKLKSDAIQSGQKLMIPLPLQSINYVVQKGDTIYSISRLYQINKDQLVKVNGLQNNNLNKGQKLKIPINPSSHYISSKVYEADMGINEFYTVAYGDTLWSISKRFGVPFSTLKEENLLVSNQVFIDQKLFISGKKHFASAKVVGAACNHIVEFLIEGKSVPLNVNQVSTSYFEKIKGKKLFISYKNGALISFY